MTEIMPVPRILILLSYQQGVLHPPVSLTPRTWDIGGGTPAVKPRTWNVGGETPAVNLLVHYHYMQSVKKKQHLF